MKVKCPTCKTDVEWTTSSVFRPFCSKKCQLIDLGEWADEQHSIPADSNTPTEQQSMPDIEEIEAMLAAQQKDFFKE